MLEKIIQGDRGVSPVFSYALTLSITTLVVGGLVLSAGAYVDDQRELTAQSELQVLGQQVSADIAAADRLNRTDDANQINISRSLPERVVGSQYSIQVRDDDGSTSPYLELQTVRPEVTVEVGIVVSDSTSIRIDATAGGGDIEVAVIGGEVVLRNG